jgi:hypothetical protein
MCFAGLVQQPLIDRAGTWAAGRVRSGRCASGLCLLRPCLGGTALVAGAVKATRRHASASAVVPAGWFKSRPPRNGKGRKLLQLRP